MNHQEKLLTPSTNVVEGYCRFYEHFAFDTARLSIIHIIISSSKYQVKIQIVCV